MSAKTRFASLPVPELVTPNISPDDDPAALAWLALGLTPGLGPRRILQAVETVGSALDLVRLPLTALEGQRFPAPSVQFLASGQASRAAEEQALRLREGGSLYLPYDDPRYPAALRQIYDPPPVLWVRGNPELLSAHALAVVGTRSPSPYGSGMAEMLSRDLAARNLLILSGMARGIDSYAHKGALAAGKPTLAVWGTGIDVIYPKENKALAQQILVSGGAIVSEQPLGTYPAPPNFPRRNRIISALSVGVLVVEAAEYSGSRLTARLAVEQNREVYAVPGNVTNKNAWGPNSLIKQGAKLVAGWEDVWEELPTQVRVALEATLPGFASETPGTAAALFENPELPPAESRVLSVLRHDESLQLDEIMEQLEGEHSSAEVFTALFELELAGRIRELPGKQYLRTF